MAYLDRFWRKATPAEFANEDRNFGGSSLLYNDPIPSTSPFVCTKEVTTKRRWNEIRKTVFSRCEETCELCGQGSSPLVVTERFEYDTTSKVQTLRRLIAMCENCHSVTRSQEMSEKDIVHLKRVREWTDEQVSVHLKEMEKVNKLLNSISWKVDFSLLPAKRKMYSG
jgi:hypothetical protein